jgi:hypothetical protein
MFAGIESCIAPLNRGRLSLSEGIEVNILLCAFDGKDVKKSNAVTEYLLRKSNDI